MPNESPNRDSLIAELKAIERHLAAVREARRPCNLALKVVREICRQRTDDWNGIVLEFSRGSVESVEAVVNFSRSLMREIERETGSFATVIDGGGIDSIARMHTYAVAHDQRTVRGAASSIPDDLLEPKIFAKISDFSVAYLEIGKIRPTALCIFKNCSIGRKKGSSYEWYPTPWQSLIHDWGSVFQRKLELMPSTWTPLGDLGDIDTSSDRARRTLLKRELNRIEVKHARQRIKGAAMAHFGKTRDLADSIRKDLLSQIEDCSRCPYCNGELGESPHADHIYPVSLGGLSTAENMVFICADCNLAKSDKTLRQFICDHSLSRDQVEARLERLDKRF